MFGMEPEELTAPTPGDERHGLRVVGTLVATVGLACLVSIGLPVGMRLLELLFR